MGTVGPRYSVDSDPGERTPLDNSSSYTQHHHYAVPPHGSLPPSTQQRPSPDRFAYNPEASQSQYEDQPSSPYRGNRQPLPSGARPNPAVGGLRSDRAQRGTPPGAIAFPSAAQPIPPPHRQTGRNWGNEAYRSSITPGADNFSEAAGGGIPGLAMSVAEQNARESGLEAMRTTQSYQQQPSEPYQRAQTQNGYLMNTQLPGHIQAGGSGPYQQDLTSSPYLAPLPADHTPPRSLNSFHSDPFGDPQISYGQRMDPRLGQFNPNDIDDDGDDGLEYGRSARNSMLSLGNSSNRGGNGASAAAATTAGGFFGGLIGKNRVSGPDRGPAQNAATAHQGKDMAVYEIGPPTEKSAWMVKQSTSRKKWTWIIVVGLVLVVAGAIVGGVLGSKATSKNSSGSGHSGGGGQSAGDDSAQNGDLNINSSEIQALLNNPNLHKVFPGVDYTPINVQYPACLTNPPSQNNVTRDVAVLSQLTNIIRLYGTDCNQTEMTIHAIQQLKMQDTIKIWLGVWQDNNKTTNARQLDQMWRILDQYGDEPFEGLIIGNEILFRQQMTTQQLGDLLNSVRTNVTRHNWNLPVATSDLGDNWNANLAQYSDCIMGNVHPFFAGQDSPQAASWAYTFWENKAGSFFKSDVKKNIISEIGWPTQGGTDCGGAPSCPKGAVAGIDDLNTLMDTWVCQSLHNGTNYFWFEMFDEPWKITFDVPGQEWEDHWGLMDVNRNLKPGVKIPDCGGLTV
ncbi:glycoside hydrolase superfamily [Xylaria nigripes]|nr:glycoside hydrolase superfamily [Xylaria nigripes]